MMTKMIKKGLAIALSAFFLSYSASGWANEADEDYKKGHESWKNGDIVGAVSLLKKAAEANHPAAQALYGYLLDAADNDEEAATFYRRASDQGNPDGKFGLAGLYTSGHGGLAKDFPAALKLLSEAASLGHKQATLSLAHHYSGSDLSAADRDSGEALKWVQKGAELDDMPSLTRLEKAYRDGELGLAVDVNKANDIQMRINKILGIDPNAKKKRRSRL